MLYAGIDIVALILHMIINKETLKKSALANNSVAAKRYRQFLLGVLIYYFIDIFWGILYDLRSVPKLFPALFAGGELYFLLMAVSVLLFVRYVVAYLDTKGAPGKLLLYSAWLLLLFEVIHLTVNFFTPVMFRFGQDNVYIPTIGRHITFAFQILLYFMTAAFTLTFAFLREGRQKLYNRAVGLTCVVMGLFMVAQFFSSDYPFYAVGCLIGTCLIHVYVEEDERIDQDIERQQNEETRKEKEIYDHIASGLASDYEAIYYINIESGHYREYSKSSEYESMNVPMSGNDFYGETRENVARFVHHDDRAFAGSLYTRESMLEKLEGRRSYSYKYRVMVNGSARYFRFTVMLAYDGKHFVLYEKDIDDEITAETLRLENQKKHITFSQIAESLAANYDALYYVDKNDGSFVCFETDHMYGQLETKTSGDRFYEMAKTDISRLFHQDDKEKAIEFLDPDKMQSALEDRKRLSIDYRLIIDNAIKYFRMTARKASDGVHYIIGVENIDNEMRREKEHLRALENEKELARRDELTGVKNKTAYKEFENAIQESIDSGAGDEPFAIVVGDMNNLKTINDTEGHRAGDDYISASAMLLCRIFAHSPVFRIGGDEFCVILRKNDYDAADELFDDLKNTVMENVINKKGPVIAAGISKYIPGTDKSVAEVFERADSQMYENKRCIKKNS